MERHSKSLIRVLGEIKPETGCEVGVHKGKNADEVLNAFEELHLYLVDPYDIGITTTLRGGQDDLSAAQLEAEGRMSKYRHRIKWLVHTAEEAALAIREPLDFVFIDADHTEESVRRDILTWYPKVRPGGIVAGHDYGGRGDKTGRFGVKPAVDSIFRRENIHVEPGLVWWVQKSHQTDDLDARLLAKRAEES